MTPRRRLKVFQAFGGFGRIVTDFTLVGLGALFHVVAGTFCLAQQEGEQLVDAFVVRAVEQCDQFSVLCIHEGVRTNTEDSGESLNAVPRSRIFRLVVSDPKRSRRLDLRTGDGQVQYNSIYEHDLISPGSRQIAFGLVPAAFLPINSKKRMSYLLSGHFPGVGLLTLTDLDIGGSAYLRSLGAARFFAKSELPNGETVVYCTLHNRQSYGKLIFRRFEQEMLPVSMEWFKDKDLVPMKESNVSLEACKDWDFVLGTYTDWRLDEKYSYMPSRAFFRRHNSPAVKDEDEYRFLDWKLGDDVDLKLLEKETFAEEEILRSVDFDKWVERFEKWKR